MPLILGIDPGLTHTGWGIIRSQGSALSYVAAGAFSTKATETLSARLKRQHDALSHVIALYRPSEAAVEETFVNKNSASSLKLGQARGAILLTLSLHHLEVWEYPANLIKKTVCGNGHAQKEQIAQIVRMLLPACQETLKPDATDALAAAICHAQHAQHRLWQKAALQGK